MLLPLVTDGLMDFQDVDQRSAEAGPAFTAISSRGLLTNRLSCSGHARDTSPVDLKSRARWIKNRRSEQVLLRVVSDGVILKKPCYPSQSLFSTGVVPLEFYINPRTHRIQR